MSDLLDTHVVHEVNFAIIFVRIYALFFSEFVIKVKVRSVS